VKIAAVATEPAKAEHLRAAQQSAYQGAQILRDLGLTERAAALEAFAKDTAQRPSYATILVPLPKPALGAGRLESALDQRLSHPDVDDRSQEKGSAADDSKPLNEAPPATIFVSYARIDNEGTDLNKRWLDRLVVFLKPNIQEDLILWNDKQLKTGEVWYETIQSKLKSAKAVILLISPEFLGSDFIRDTELPIILQRHADGQLKIFPLILRPCGFQHAKYKYPHPKNGPNEMLLRSIMTLNPPSEALNEIEEGKQDRFFVKLADELFEQLGQHS
jgi:TIR domain